MLYKLNHDFTAHQVVKWEVDHQLGGSKSYYISTLTHLHTFSWFIFINEPSHCFKPTHKVPMLLHIEPCLEKIKEALIHPSFFNETMECISHLFVKFPVNYSSEFINKPNTVYPFKVLHNNNKRIKISFLAAHQNKLTSIMDPKYPFPIRE